MSNINKIKSTLSFATTSLLLNACSTESNNPQAVANTSAPELIGTWQSTCVVLPSSKLSTTGNSAVTLAAASGGGNSGGGSSSGGQSRRDTITFNQDGRAQFLSEYFASGNCNSSTRLPASMLNSLYFVGNSTQERFGSNTVELDYQAGSDRVYSMFQVVNNIELYIGDEDASSSGHNGTSATARFDGLGVRMSKQ